MQDRLQSLATDFAGDLSDLAATVSAASPPFSVKMMESPKEEGKFRCSVKQDGSTYIPLKVGNKLLLTVSATFMCTLDHRWDFLAVDSSEFKVFAKRAEKQPLFRWDYLREPREDGVPSAHMHVEAHRDAVTYVMVKSGNASDRSQNRAKKQLPSMAQLHFPLGGSRFRPCLEDLLEGLIHEFGINHDDTVLERLADGRERWRMTQLNAAIRDVPEVAAEKLESLGYEVVRPEILLPSRPEKMRRF